MQRPVRPERRASPCGATSGRRVAWQQCCDDMYAVGCRFTELALDGWTLNNTWHAAQRGMEETQSNTPHSTQRKGTEWRTEQGKNPRGHAEQALRSGLLFGCRILSTPHMAVPYDRRVAYASAPSTRNTQSRVAGGTRKVADSCSGLQQADAPTVYGAAELSVCNATNRCRGCTALCWAARPADASLPPRRHASAASPPYSTLHNTCRQDTTHKAASDYLHTGGHWCSRAARHRSATPWQDRRTREPSHADYCQFVEESDRRQTRASARRTDRRSLVSTASRQISPNLHSPRHLSC